MMKLAKFKPTTAMHPFTVSHLDGLLEIRTDTEDLCFWPCPYGNSEIVFDGFVKCDGGIRHLVHRYTRVTVHGAALDTLCYGNLSRRPYQLAQPCDGSITDCVLALFAQWCRDNERCPNTLYRNAYPHEQPPQWNKIVAAAEWQGIAYPARRDEKAKMGLLASLHAINCHTLAGIVSDFG